MHLSTGFPGVRMRKEEYGQSDHTKADPSIKRRTGGEQPFKERKNFGYLSVRERRNKVMASYIHGTGAEKLAPYRKRRKMQRKRRQDVGRSVKRQHRIRRNQERAMYMDLPYVIMLTLASICTLYLLR
mgnify:CR=1 FL=1